MVKKHSFHDWYQEHISISLSIQSATDDIHKIRIETAVLPDHSQKMSENIITSDGLLSAPGTSNAFENESHTTSLMRMIYSASPMMMNKSLRIKCLENLNCLNSNAKAATGALKGVPANQGQNSTENATATAHPQRIVNGAIVYSRRTRLAKPQVRSKL